MPQMCGGKYWREDNYCHHFSSTTQTQSSADRKEREQKEETDESKVQSVVREAQDAHTHEDGGRQRD
jgi:hypothetical protein